MRMETAPVGFFHPGDAKPANPAVLAAERALDGKSTSEDLPTQVREREKCNPGFTGPDCSEQVVFAPPPRDVDGTAADKARLAAEEAEQKIKQERENYERGMHHLNSRNAGWPMLTVILLR